MGIISRGFSGRRSTADVKLPPGQYLTTDFPVLSAGPTPHVSLDVGIYDRRRHESFADDGTGSRFASCPPKLLPPICIALRDGRNSAHLGKASPSIRCLQT